MSDQFEYTVIVHKADEGGFWSEVPALPGAGSQGESVEEAIANTKESIEAVLQVMKARGETVRSSDDVVVKVTVAA